MLDNFNRNSALAIGAIALIIGAVGPWVTLLGVIGAGPLDFTEVALTVFGSIALVIASALTGRYMRLVSIVAGLTILSAAGYVWFELSEANMNELVKPGWGLFLSTIAAIYLITSTWIAKRDPQVAA